MKTFIACLYRRHLLNDSQHYSDYSEAYSLPGDIKSKGAHFLAEAESCLMKHQLEGRGEIRLSSLQATLLLYERYAAGECGLICDKSWALLIALQDILC